MTMWRRWRRGVPSRLAMVVIEKPGAVITTSGLKRSRTLRTVLIEKRQPW